MAKFKVGEKVRLRKGLKVNDECGGLHLFPHMVDELQEGGEIEYNWEGVYYVIKNLSTIWHEDMLESAEDEVVELSLKEIAEKFQVPVSMIRIKD